MIALVGTVLPKVPEPDMYGDHRELIPSSPRTCTCALASDISLRGRADRWSGRRVDLVSRRQRVQASRMRRRVMMSAPARAMNASLMRVLTSVQIWSFRNLSVLRVVRSTTQRSPICRVVPRNRCLGATLRRGTCP